MILLTDGYQVKFLQDKKIVLNKIFCQIAGQSFSLNFKEYGAIPKSFKSVFYDTFFKASPVVSLINPFFGTPSFLGNKTSLLT